MLQLNYLRRVIRIRAEDSPNVKRGLAQRAAGIEPDHREVVPGVLTLREYDFRRRTWDKVRQCVGLDAQFYRGAEVMLFPPEWLQLCRQRAEQLKGRPRRAKAIGIDPAEGGDKTAMAAADELGIVEVVSRKTANTAQITGEAVAFGRKHGVPPDKWFFDRGGGGQQHADRLREQGFDCKTVAFGSGPSLDPKRGITLVESRMGIKEERYVYVTRRAEMYHQLSLGCDPSLNCSREGEPEVYAIPCDTEPAIELHRQLGLMPKQFRIPGTTTDWSMWDGEGRIRMLPKNNRTTGNDGNKIPCLTDLLGCSPDEADAAVLARWGVFHKVARPEVWGM